MTGKKHYVPVSGAVLSPILFRPGRLTDVADRYTAPCLIIRHGVRLLACLVLLGAVAACGSHWGRAPVNTMAGDAALTEAMVLEKVPTSWHASLAFIMGQESSGRVGIHNADDTARGLFQLVAANYNMNPNGLASFGKGVEEAQGGIRYIKQRYGTADHAAAHWHQYHWS